MKSFFVYPYSQKSASAKALAEALDGKRVLREGSSYKYSKDHVLINWGCGECPHPQALNSKIMDLIDKRKFFDRLKGTGLTPPFATTLEAAKTLGYPVFCRTIVDGKDGQGIVIADCLGQLVSSKLYVKGINKTAEYRVHVARQLDGNVKFLGGAKKGQKEVSPDMTNVPSDKRILAGETAYFGDYTTDIPLSVIGVAIKALEYLKELTFAAFDVVTDGKTAYVIEGNSAPMATPQTTKAYAKFFQQYAADLTAKEASEAASKVPPVSVPTAPKSVAPTPQAGTGLSSVAITADGLVSALQEIITCYQKNR